VTGTTPTAVLIQQGLPGVSGPRVVSLVRTLSSTWTVPTGSRLTADQFEAFKAGGLYVNVQSRAHLRGELRVQLKPPSTLQNTPGLN